MTYPVWPAGIDRVERDSFQIQPQDGRLRRQSDTGPRTFRRRFSGVAQMVSLSVVLSRNQKAIFDHFYNVDCAGGATFFRMPDPSTDGWGLYGTSGLRLTSNGVPLHLSRMWLCSWGEAPPVETMVGDTDFRKAFTVQVMP